MSRNRGCCIFNILLLAVVTCPAQKIDPSLLCTVDYCKNYLSDKSCPPLSEECVAQNSTHSGTMLLSTDFCNCCEYCLTHLDEGETCSKGGLGSPPTGNICGPGLYCTTNDDNPIPKCLRMESKCHSAQDDYDKRREDGTLGFLEERPICDESGLFGPVACIPGQTCFCTDEEGKKIFGEAINIRSVSKEMNCECSRVMDKTEKLLRSKMSHGLRCAPDGSFDELQCTKNRCFCVFKESGLISSNVIIDLGVQYLTQLPCYNSSIHHSPVSYLRQCEENKLEIIESLVQFEEDGYTYLGDPIPTCQADGNYQPVLRINDSLVCVTPEGDPIENYRADLDSPNVNCHCARTKHLLKSITSAHVIPYCCSDGNWGPIQCRQNKCYCVDVYDGRQMGLEVDSERLQELECYTPGRNWEDC